MFTNFQKNCIELIDSMPKKQSRHCFRSALRHLELAQALTAQDPGMAIFRGITAEEEAASGLMFCLRELKYPGSENLRPHNHVQKHALFPFLKIVGLFFGQALKDFLKSYRLHIKEEKGHRRLMLAFPLLVESEENWAYPMPPLNFGIKVGKNSAPLSYEKQITEYLAARGANSIRTYLKKEANLRNEVLYAGPSGYPEVRDLKPEFLQEKAAHVVVLLQAYLLIGPYDEVQPYVGDALGAFTVMIGGMEQLKDSSSKASQVARFR